MYTEFKLNELKNRFSFHGVVPDPELEKDANLKLIQLLALAPPAAYAQAYVQWTGEGYFAKVEVHSPFRAFYAQSLGNNPSTVVKQVLQKLEDQIYHWRFGRGTGTAGNNSKSSQLSQLPWVSRR